jgi:NADPH-dependent 2,4-dienoyl-CoA reductase/sulfur reductase-like enzyme
MLGHNKPGDADRKRQGRLHKPRIYRDLDRSAHHSSASRNGSSVKMQQVMRSSGKVPNIAIVGAGIAALRCADVLIKSGAKVTIFEARDRIGGRVCEDSGREGYAKAKLF